MELSVPVKPGTMYRTASMGKSLTATAALAPFRNDTLRFEPGTDYLYSSYGYDVIGCALEGAAGVPFMDVMRRTVFEPAGMARACQDDPAAIVPGRAAGYVRIGGQLRVATVVVMTNLESAPERTPLAESIAAIARRGWKPL